MINPTLEMIVGAAFIVLYSYSRFNTPPTTRASTTAFRYHFGATLYTFTILAIYCLLASVRPLATEFSGEEVSPNLLLELSDPLLAALLLTVLLPNTPWLSEIDSILRKKAQKVAAIPFEVRRLSQELRRLPLDFPEAVRQQTRAELSRQGIEEADLLFDTSDAPQHVWTRISALMTSLNAWETDSRFVSFAVRFSAEWDAVRRDYRRLSSQAAKCFRFARDVTESGADERTGELAAEYLAHFQDQAKDLLGRLYDFVAHAVLDCEITPSARRERLARFGFHRPSVKEPWPKDSLVGVFLLLFLLAVVGLVLTGRVAPMDVIQIAVFITTSYIVAVLASLVMKSRRKPRRSASRAWRPWAAYLLAGLVAVGAASLFRLAGHLAFQLANPAEWLENGVGGLLVTTGEIFLDKCPWMLVSFATAFVLALNLDNEPTDTFDGYRLRAVEGTLQGVVSALAALGALWLLPPPVPPLLSVLSISSVLGFLIGFLVPAAHRNMAQEVERTEPGPDAVSAVAVAT